MALGKAIAEEFAKANANVVIADFNDEKANETKKEFENCKGKIMACHIDVSNPNDFTKLIEDVKKELGSIDVLVNNAGICESVPLVDMDVKAIDRMIKINLNGIVYGCKAVLPTMHIMIKLSICLLLLQNLGEPMQLFTLLLKQVS